jgi:hypothetical protein
LDGIWTIGAASLTETADHRRAYVERWDGSNNLRSVLDLMPPWIMDIQIDPITKMRYALASVWNETDHATSQLAYSKTGEINSWTVVSIPMPSAISLTIVPGGVLIAGGKYGEWGGVYFQKIG